MVNADFGTHSHIMIQNQDMQNFKTVNQAFGSQGIDISDYVPASRADDPMSVYQDVSRDLVNGGLPCLGNASFYNLYGPADQEQNPMKAQSSTKSLHVSTSSHTGPANHSINGALIEMLTGLSEENENLDAYSDPPYFTSWSDNYNVFGIEYDANGNLTKLSRNADGALDILGYEYYENSNKLARVSDQVNSTTHNTDMDNQPDNQNYSYNAIGNMTGDKKSYTGEPMYYTYNHLQQVTGVYPTQADADNRINPVATYLYDEHGRRTQKTVFSGQGSTEIYYQRFAGGLAAIYTSQNGGTEALAEMPISGNGNIGTALFSGTAVDAYRYPISDHLGNVRAVVGEAATGEAEVKAYADYYPFGMKMPGRCNEGTDLYRHGYQGLYSEQDPETGLNHFLLRDYDPRLGRWHKTDPYNQFHSPYIGMGNNPVSGVDPDGGIIRYVRGVWGYWSDEPDGEWDGKLSSLIYHWIAIDDGMGDQAKGPTCLVEMNLGGGGGGGAFVLPHPQQVPDVPQKTDVPHVGGKPTVNGVPGPWSIEYINSNTNVTVFVETDFPGHAYIRIGNTVYDYGEWNGGFNKDSFGPVGDGILLKFEGSDADNYINIRSADNDTKSYVLKGLDANKMIGYYDNISNGSPFITINDPIKRQTNVGFHIDSYNLLNNHCATKVTQALQAGGAPFIPENYSMSPTNLSWYLSALQLMN